jgi:hypothetical protein
MWPGRFMCKRNPFDVAMRRPLHGLTRAMTTEPIA